MPTPAPDIARKMVDVLVDWKVPEELAAQMLAGSWQQVYRLATGKRHEAPGDLELLCKECHEKHHGVTFG